MNHIIEGTPALERRLALRRKSDLTDRAKLELFGELVAAATAISGMARTFDEYSYDLAQLRNVLAKCRTDADRCTEIAKENNG